MSVCIRVASLGFMALLIAVGCAVNEEKIELWKGTKNGPKKLAATVIDKEVSMMNGNAFPDFTFDNTQKLLKEYGPTMPQVDEKLFHTHLRHLEKTGFISHAN